MSPASAASRPPTAHWSSWPDLDGPEEVRELVRFVRRGGVVIFPTESSYALGADPESAEGVANVFRIKRRPADKPLPVVASDLEMLKRLGVEGASTGFSGLERAWPGPLTLISPCRRALPAACGRNDLAVRVPGHERLRRLLSRAGVALTATSANLAGEAPLLELTGVEALTGENRVFVIDQGRLGGGPPSTLIRLEGGYATVLRPGAMSLDAVRDLAPDVRFEDGFSAGAVEIPVEEGG